MDCFAVLGDGGTNIAACRARSGRDSSGCSPARTAGLHARRRQRCVVSFFLIHWINLLQQWGVSNVIGSVSDASIYVLRACELAGLSDSCCMQLLISVQVSTLQRARPTVGAPPLAHHRPPCLSHLGKFRNTSPICVPSPAHIWASTPKGTSSIHMWHRGGHGLVALPMRKGNSRAADPQKRGEGA